MGGGGDDDDDDDDDASYCYSISRPTPVCAFVREGEIFVGCDGCEYIFTAAFSLPNRGRGVSGDGATVASLRLASPRSRLGKAGTSAALMLVHVYRHRIGHRRGTRIHRARILAWNKMR